MQTTNDHINGNSTKIAAKSEDGYDFTYSAGGLEPVLLT